MSPVFWLLVLAAAILGPILLCVGFEEPERHTDSARHFPGARPDSSGGV